MKNILLPLLFLCLSKPLGLWAQQEITSETLPRYRITTIPSQLLFSEMIIHAEKIKPKQSIGLMLGYRFKGLTETNEIGWERILEDTHLALDYQGILLGINKKSFFSDKRRGFWDFQAFVRHWWERQVFDEIDYRGDRYKGRSAYMVEVAGIKILLGKTCYLTHTGTTRPILTLYTGLGVRGKFYHDQTKFTINGVPHENPGGVEVQVFPTLQLGFSVGVEKFAKAVSATD